MTAPANPIVLDMAFERLQFETGFDVRAVIAERDALRTDRTRLAVAHDVLDDALREMGNATPVQIVVARDHIATVLDGQAA